MPADAVKPVVNLRGRDTIKPRPQLPGEIFARLFQPLCDPHKPFRRKCAVPSRKCPEMKYRCGKASAPAVNVSAVL